MKVDLYATPDGIQEKNIRERIAVVIDVLRATTTITTALYNGCKEVIPVIDIEEAVSAARNYEPNTFLLGGERNAQKIEGFNLGNSPREYTRDAVEGKTIIFTTTNGTKAIRKAVNAKEVVIASFLNVSAVCNHIKNEGRDIAIVCAGTDGRFSLEDILAAGAIISQLKVELNMEQDDLGLVSCYMFEKNRNNLSVILRDTYHYSRLVKLGFDKDVEKCLAMDAAPIVPVYRDGVIKYKSSESE